VKTIIRHYHCNTVHKKIWWTAHAAVCNDFDVVAKSADFSVNTVMRICHCWFPQVFYIRWHEPWLVEENTEQFHCVVVHVAQQSKQSAQHILLISHTHYASSSSNYHNFHHPLLILFFSPGSKPTFLQILPTTDFRYWSDRAAFMESRLYFKFVAHKL